MNNNIENQDDKQYHTYSTLEHNIIRRGGGITFILVIAICFHWKTPQTFTHLPLVSDMPELPTRT